MKVYNVKVKVQKDEKPVSELYCVWAVSVSDAETKTYEYFKGSVVDFEVVAVTETKVIDVFGKEE